MNLERRSDSMLNFNIKTILKTALGVSLIYIMAILLTLCLCDRVSELENSKDMEIMNRTTAMNLK